MAIVIPIVSDILVGIFTDGLNGLIKQAGGGLILKWKVARLRPHLAKRFQEDLKSQYAKKDLDLPGYFERLSASDLDALKAKIKTFFEEKFNGSTIPWTDLKQSLKKDKYYVVLQFLDETLTPDFFHKIFLPPEFNQADPANGAVVRVKFGTSIGKPAASISSLARSRISYPCGYCRLKFGGYFRLRLFFRRVTYSMVPRMWMLSPSTAEWMLTHAAPWTAARTRQYP